MNPNNSAEAFKAKSDRFEHSWKQEGIQVCFESASCWDINSVFKELPTHKLQQQQWRWGYTTYIGGGGCTNIH